jgi:hypothetical protein
MVFRLGGIDIIVISRNGQAVDLGQFTSPARSSSSTPALCSEIYTQSSSRGSAARSGPST